MSLIEPFVSQRKKTCSNSLKQEIFDFISRQLQNVSCMRVNKVHINEGKCCYMHFKPPGSKDNFTYNTLLLRLRTIPKVFQRKFLGVIIDEGLSWKPHITDLTKRLKIHAGSMTRIMDNDPKHLHKSLYLISLTV